MSSQLYTVTGTNNFCNSSATIGIQVIPTPDVVVATSNTSICNGSQVLLLASGANTYGWSTQQNSGSILVSPANTTVYTVTGTGANNCSSTSSISIVVNPLP